MSFALGSDNMTELKLNGCFLVFFLLIIIMDTDMFNTLPVWQKAQSRIFSSEVLYFIKHEQKLLHCLLFPLVQELLRGAAGQCL